MQLGKAVETLESAIRFHHFSPALPERLHVVKRLLEGRLSPMSLRSLAAPIYITDLGIRRIVDPKIFYQAHCKICSITPATDTEITAGLVSTPINRLKEALDAAILFFGNYDAASTAITTRKNEILEDHNPELLSAAGTISAATSTQDSELFFTKAVSLAANYSDSYIYSHRLAATLIKRQHRINDAIKILDTQFTICNQRNNVEKELALLFNLKALAVLMRDKNIIDAMELVNSSLEMLEYTINNQSYSDDSLSRLCRYRSQVHINKAQLLLKIGKQQEAATLLENNLHYTAQHSHEYIGEAAASLALTYYLSKDYPSASRTSIYAIIKLSEIGAISALAASRRVFIASQSKIGNIQEATRTLHLLKTDPLGLTLPLLEINRP